MRTRIQHLEIILKLSERCNINCTYCYVFNKGSSISDDAPPALTEESIADFRKFIDRAHDEYDIGTLQIDFHGGEPLMLKKQRFAHLCEELLQTRRPGSTLSLALQTNGILVDDGWIDLFRRYDVFVSVSIDGTRAVNDRYRLDKRGRGTYDRTVAGLRRLQAAHRDGRLPYAPGVLSVINPEACGAETYRHFVDDLGVRGFDFLLPDDSYDDAPVDDDGIGRFLTGALDEWIRDGDPSIRVRIFHTHLARLLGAADAGVLGHTPTVSGTYAFTVGADGIARVDDTLRSTADPIFDPIGHVADSSLGEILSSPAFRQYEAIGGQLPEACGSCIWNRVCSGGRIVNRFSRQQRFDRKTVYCGATRRFLSRASSHLLNMGLPEERLMSTLES